MTTAESPGREGNRTGATSDHVDDGITVSVSESADIPAQLRRRRAASWQLPRLDCGRRDPLDLPPAGPGPGTYGLTPVELRRHAADLRRRGWTVEEILAVLDVDGEPVRHCPCCPRAAVTA